MIEDNKKKKKHLKEKIKKKKKHERGKATAFSNHKEVAGQNFDAVFLRNSGNSVIFNVKT